DLWRHLRGRRPPRHEAGHAARTDWRQVADRPCEEALTSQRPLSGTALSSTRPGLRSFCSHECNRLDKIGAVLVCKLLDCYTQGINRPAPSPSSRVLYYLILPKQKLMIYRFLGVIS